MRAMNAMGISLGQTASHSPWLVQLPKSFRVHLVDHRGGTSIFFRLALGERVEVPHFGRHEEHGRGVRAGRHAGAAADAGGPSIESSALSFGYGNIVGLGGISCAHRNEPPLAMIRSKALRSTIRSLTTGKAAARHGSMVKTSPLWKLRMWSWQVVVARRGPCGFAVDHDPALPANSLAAVVIEGDRLLALPESSAR